MRQSAPNGRVRVLATNLDAEHFHAALFGHLYHQRWRIEEAFKRLKHRLHLEGFSGLSQQALIIDVQRLLPRLVLSIGDVVSGIANAIHLPARTSQCTPALPASSGSSPQTSPFVRIQGVIAKFGGFGVWQHRSVKIIR